MKHTCSWWLASGPQCGKPVRYLMEKDDDGKSVRRYDNLCEEHAKKAEEQRAAREESKDDFGI